MHLGRVGEDVACERYSADGYSIVARNWRARIGEIDLIARKDDLLVFCEVKCRTGYGFGTPAESVTIAKQQRIRKLAALWLAANATVAIDVRFDVAEVIVRRGRLPSVQVIEGAF